MNRYDFLSSLQCEVEVSTGWSQSDKIIQQILVDNVGENRWIQKFGFFLYQAQRYCLSLKVPEIKIAGS